MAEHDDGTAAAVAHKIGGESPEKKADHDETAREIIGGEELLEKTDRDSTVFGKLINKVRGSSSSSSDSDDDRSSTTLKSKVFRLFGREKPVHKVLGGGKPADLFLWKNKKTSGGVLGGATVLWLLFEVFEYHIIPLICYALILVLAVLFLWSNASVFINKSPPHIPEVHIPEEPVLQIVSALRVEFNRGFAILRDIATGRDLKKFLSVIFGLWATAFFGGLFSFLTLLYIGVVVLFTVPLFYDKYEDQVDAFGEKAVKEIKKQYAVFDAKVLSKIPRGTKDKKH